MKNLFCFWAFVALMGFFVACEPVGPVDPEDPVQDTIPQDTLKKGILTFEDDEETGYCGGGQFYRVSDNGKYVVGSSEMTHAAYVYVVGKDSIFCLNPEWEENEEFSHLVRATAMDVSDAGIVVGQYAFDDTYARPAFYNISASSWTELELPEGTKGSITADGSLYGEATSISADGKFISGYIISYMDNGTSRRNVACIWTRTNDDELNPTYKLQLPIDTETSKIHCNGDWAWHMSNDGKWLGGITSAKSGCFNVGIWENKGEGSLLERTLLIGKEDWIRTEDDNGDGIIDDEDGGDTTIVQYDWNGQVSGISPSGEWIVGYHNYNGTGIIPDDVAAGGVKSYPNVGFRYNTITKELEDSLESLPTVVFDDGSMIFYEGGDMIVNSSSLDGKIKCGAYMVMTEMGAMNMAVIIIE